MTDKEWKELELEIYKDRSEKSAGLLIMRFGDYYKVFVEETETVVMDMLQVVHPFGPYEADKGWVEFSWEQRDLGNVIGSLIADFIVTVDYGEDYYEEFMAISEDGEGKE
jgi:hypothetical protein